MEQTNLSIEKIEIENFKKIRDLVIEPRMGANLFFGSFRSGKTSLCEFIQFILFGADSVALARDNAENALGKISFSFGEKKYLVERSVIGGKEDLCFIDCETGCPVVTDMTPGEYLTGLDRESFDLISYFKQAKYETPVFKPSFSFLNELSALHPDTQSIYRDQRGLEERWLRFRNHAGTGSLDLLCQQKDTLSTLIQDRPKWEKEAEDCKLSLEEITKKLDENDKRCVLLKADMAGYADDLILSRNKENAEDLLKSIQAKEKKYRIAHYDVTHKVGLLSQEELEGLKEDYNRLSLAVTNLSEARGALTMAEETLTFHRRLFTGKDNVEHFRKEKKRISRLKMWRMIFCILGIGMMGTGAALYFLFRFLQHDLVFSLAIAASTAFCGFALECISTVFTVSIRKILEENKKNDLKEFYEFYDTLLAHDRTTQVYREKVMSAEESCKTRTLEKDTVTRRISQKIDSLGYSEEDGEILAICDQIIEANDALYDLLREIEEEKAEYQRILSAHVEKETLSVSPEFATLQKELSFLLVQNESLYKKKALLSARLQEAQDHLSADPAKLEKELAAVVEKFEEEEKEYQALDLSLSLANARKERFEAALKDRLAGAINDKISFVLGEGESFLFDDRFELCFRDRNCVLPLIALGGGVISEMGLLAFRLSLAELLGKTNLPMIFDDSFAMLSPEAAGQLYTVLEKTCSQYFIATSSRDLIGICQDSAKIISL